VSDWTAAEIMAVAIARELRDRETIAVGNVSPIPASAALLAARRHAPHARLLIVGSASHFPFTGGMQEFYNFAMRGKLDVFFASGAQIDANGNFNLSVIGDHARPAVRLPGGRANGVLPFLARRVILFRTGHGPRVFVPRVDFITAPGTPPDGVYRLGGLSRVVTDLCVLAFAPERRRLELSSIHPGTTVEQVQERTGFPLHAPSPAPVTTAPSREELALLRGPVREDLARVYPQFVTQQA
jgi:glutaconate CoA-transferase subunit B